MKRDKHTEVVSSSAWVRKVASGFTLVEMLIVIAIISILIGMLLPAVQMAREESRRTTCTAKMAQIGLAIHSYQDAHLFYPPGTIETKGPIQHVAKGYHHNWISFILPQLDRVNMERAIDRTQSVYAPANADVYKRTLEAVYCPSSDPGLAPMISNYAGVHHPNEVPIDIDNAGMFFLNSRLRPRDVKDGLSHTLFVGERAAPETPTTLGWMSGTRATLRNLGHPFHADVDPLPPNNRIVGGFGSAHPQVVQFLLGNGAVVAFPRTIDRKALQKLADRQDGALVDEGLYLGRLD